MDSDNANDDDLNNVKSPDSDGDDEILMLLMVIVMMTKIKMI